MEAAGAAEAVQAAPRAAAGTKRKHGEHKNFPVFYKKDIFHVLFSFLSFPRKRNMLY